MLPSAIVFDVETIGTAHEDLPGSVQEYLVRRAKSPEEAEVLKRQTGLSPMTGEVACVVLHRTETGKSLALTRPGTQTAPGGDQPRFETFEHERDLLLRFWQIMEKAPRAVVVTFNGRSFDVPFLMVRSGIREVRVARDLLGNRYQTSTHVDLYDQLRFQGASSSPPFNLDLACHAFGIPTPKSEEAHGYKVQEMWLEGRGVDIAQYCHGDVLATAELYRRWQEFIHPG